MASHAPEKIGDQESNQVERRQTLSRTGQFIYHPPHIFSQHPQTVEHIAPVNPGQQCSHPEDKKAGSDHPHRTAPFPADQ